MEYNKYTKEFAKLIGDIGFVEGHFDFSVDSSGSNPDYPAGRADDIEDRIRRYQDPEVASPGIQYTRSGISFHVDMVSVKLEGHLDYLERVCTEIGVLSGFGLVPVQKDNRRNKRIEKK